MSEEKKKPYPKMWKKEKESQKRKSLKNESRLSNEVGFDLTPGSGNTIWPGNKGDGKTDKFMFECKETLKSSLNIKEKDIRKLVLEASTIGKDPALILSMYGFAHGIPKDWVAVPVETFKWLVSDCEE